MNGLVKSRAVAASFALIAALAAFLFAGSAVSAQLPTNLLLVGNIGPSTTSTAITSDVAQAFTTGGNAGGYTLTSVALPIRRTGATHPTYSVKIYSASDSGSPRNLLGTLTNPSSLPTQVNPLASQFTSSGIRLGANATYFLVIDIIGDPGGSSPIALVSSDDEDSDGETGWSIAASSLSREWDHNMGGKALLEANHGWIGSDIRVSMALDGYAGQGPAPAASSLGVPASPVIVVVPDTTSRSVAVPGTVSPASPVVVVDIPHQTSPGVRYVITVGPR